MKVSLRPAEPADAAAVAEVLIESRQTFLPFAPSPHTPAEVQHWVADRLIPGGKVVVAELRGKVVAALATSDRQGISWIDQLYVLPGQERQGIGTQLLHHVHTTLRPPIRVYTFQANSGARRFYERHGYEAIQFTDGLSNEERCPDVLYERRANSPGA